MKTALDFKRPSQPVLARLLEKLLQEPGGNEESVRTTSLVSALVEDARRERASDVHLDPDSDGFQVRFRIDGAVIDTLRLSSAEGNRIVRACKSLADLEPGTARLPQGGRAELNVTGRTLAVRVATAPTIAGEKLTLRILREALARSTLNQDGGQNRRPVA